MILLSNLIKSSSYIPLDDIRKIEAKDIHFHKSSLLDHTNDSDDPNSENHIQDEMLEESIRLKDQIIQDAKDKAEDLIRAAREQAEQIVAAAKEEANQWWQNQRDEDEVFREQIRLASYEEGYVQGSKEAELRIEQQFEARISEGRYVLEQAYEASRQTISEAEPFLIDLSCAVAEKIIGKQLSLSPELVLDMIRSALRRSMDKETVTLCVSPAQFSYVQSVRDELSNAIDAQVELRILPDPSVQDRGCVIKTSFGSIDARVETQLTEIKQALLDLCKREDNANDN